MGLNDKMLWNPERLMFSLVVSLQFITLCVTDWKTSSDHLRFRSRWLKEPDANSTELFRMVAEIFILWCKSHVSLMSDSRLRVFEYFFFLFNFFFCLLNAEL